MNTKKARRAFFSQKSVSNVRFTECKCININSLHYFVLLQVTESKCIEKKVVTVAATLHDDAQARIRQAEREKANRHLLINGIVYAIALSLVTGVSELYVFFHLPLLLESEWGNGHSYLTCPSSR